jgi:hypothetical protein
LLGKNKVLGAAATNFKHEWSNQEDFKLRRAEHKCDQKSGSHDVIELLKLTNLKHPNSANFAFNM